MSHTLLVCLFGAGMGSLAAVGSIHLRAMRSKWSRWMLALVLYGLAFTATLYFSAVSKRIAEARLQRLAREEELQSTKVMGECEMQSRILLLEWRVLSLEQGSAVEWLNKQVDASHQLPPENTETMERDKIE